MEIGRYKLPRYTDTPLPLNSVIPLFSEVSTLYCITIFDLYLPKKYRHVMFLFPPRPLPPKKQLDPSSVHLLLPALYFQDAGRLVFFLGGAKNIITKNHPGNVVDTCWPFLHLSDLLHGRRHRRERLFDCLISGSL